MEWDHTGTFPTEVFAALHKMGVLKMGVPTKWGGLGSSMPELLDLTTTLAEFSPGMVSSLMGNLAAQTALYRFAPESLALQIFADQEKTGALMSFCATEKSGTDISRLATQAIPSTRGYLLSGEKKYITNAPRADHFVVLARVENSIKAFYVPAHSPGVQVEAPLKKMGHNESETAHITFDKVRLPATYLLKEDGLSILNVCISRTKALLAGACVGICQAARDLAVSYLRATERYGKTLLEIPELRSHLAHLQVQTEAARGLALLACRTWDAQGSSQLESSSAKYFAANTAMDCVTASLEMCGASGYMAEHRLTKLFRDAKLIQIYEGASHVQLALISRALFPKEKYQKLRRVS